MSLIQKSFSDLITFTRASGGGRFNASGQYEWLPANTPRIDFDPVTGECLGLLIEEQRTNLLTYSSDFANAVWVKVGATINTGAAIAPGGSAAATKVIESAASDYHWVRQNAAINSGTQTFSVFVQGAGRARFALDFVISGDTARNTIFDIPTASVVRSTGIDKATLVDIGGGWLKATITATIPVSGSLRCGLFLIPDGGTSFTYTGDGTSGIYIWGAQLEAGSFPTSYIPTTNAQVTRAADIASVNELSPWFNASEGTLFVEAVRTHPLASGGANLIDLGDGTYGERIYLALNAANNNSFSGDWRSSNLSPDYFVNTSSKWAPGVIARAAIAWGADRVAAAQGSIVKTSASTVVPGVTKMGIGKPVAGSGGELNGHVKQIRYYPKRLSDAELRALTA